MRERTTLIRSVVGQEASRRTESLIPAGIFLFALMSLVAAEPWARPIEGDAALFVHYGYRVLAGDVPYRDFFDHKTPLTTFVNAAALGIGRHAGGDPLVWMRIPYLAAMAVVVTLLYSLALTMWERRSVGISAALIGLGYGQLGTWAATGSAPKLLMLVFGLACWRLGLSRRWAAAGAAAGMSFLAWQPGGTYLIVACWLAFGLDRARWKRAWVHLGAGFGVPFLGLLLYLTLAGALRDFVLQTIVFNASYVRTVSDTPLLLMSRFLGKEWELFGDEPVALLAAVGGIPVTGWMLRDLVRKRAWPRFATLATLPALMGAWLLLHLANAGGQSDAIAFIPAVTLFPAALVAAWSPAVEGWLVKRGSDGTTVLKLGQGVALAVLIGVAILNIRRSDPAGLREERAAAAALIQVGQLKPGDAVMNLGAFSFAALWDAPNPAKYPYTYSGVPEFVKDHDPDGAEVYRSEAESARPKLIIYRSVDSLRAFNRWLAANYTVCTNPAISRALGNDPDLIMDSIDHEEEQSGMAAADAAHARRSGDEYAAERDLAESRSWANSAQTKREALNWLTAQAGTPFVEFAFDNEMRAVRLAAWAVADAYQACFADECDENPADCPTHGGLVAARKLAEESETDRLRSRFLDAFHASAAKRTA